jgi:hypothetical protein
MRNAPISFSNALLQNSSFVSRAVTLQALKK